MDEFSEEQVLSLVAQIQDWQVSLETENKAPLPSLFIRLGPKLTNYNRVSHLTWRYFG